MNNLIVVLDNVRSMHNVGSILRTCDGFGVTKVIVCGLTPYPEISDDPRLSHVTRRASAQIAKTALGAEKSVEIQRFKTLTEAIKFLKSNDIPVWAIEQAENSVKLSDVQPPKKPTAIVLGNEVEGVDLMHSYDKVIEIEMRGQKESFNVSVTAGIVIYQLTQK